MKIDTEERAARARALFEGGLNCAQSVASAYADVCGVESELIERLTLALGGGVGRQREVCGTVSGASVVLGMVYPEKKECYLRVQQFGTAFRTVHGSIVCRELLGLPVGADSTPTPSPRTAEYYRRRPCAEYVEQAARIAGQIINEKEV